MKKIIASFLVYTFIFANLNCIVSAKTSVVLPNSSPLKTEHLMQSEKVKKKAPTDIVVTTPNFSRVLEYNIIEVAFAENFSTKTAKVGDDVPFLLNEDLKTTQGTVVLPAGSVINAKVATVIKPKSFNRSGKVYLVFKEITLPNGSKSVFEAKVFNRKNEMLSRGKANALGKGLGTTLGSMGVATGAGCGIGVAAGAVVVGGLAIGMPIGFAVGVLAGFATPGLHYKAKAGDKLLIQLTDNLDIQR